MNKPLFISCHTPDKMYQSASENLMNSLIKFGLDHEIWPYLPPGSWQDNTCYKPIFIKAMMGRHPTRSLVWLDADAEVVSNPDLFFKLKSDVATGYMAHKNEFLTGTMFFANNEKTKCLIRLWLVNLQIEDRNPRKEQRAFSRAIAPLIQECEVTYEQLPPEYIHIFDSQAHGSPVIVHNQLSREAKVKEGYLRR